LLERNARAVVTMARICCRGGVASRAGKALNPFGNGRRLDPRCAVRPTMFDLPQPSGDQTMKRSIQVLAALSLASASFSALAASATVSDCWVRLLPGSLPSGAYFDVTNASNSPLELDGVDSDAFGMAMLHRTQSNGSTSSMEMVKSATVPANGTLKFAPGGYHVMLEEPKAPLKVGSTIALTFSFSNGEKTTAQCAVKSPATMGH